MQLWSSNTYESNKLNWYRLFKNNFSLQTETHLNCINNCKFRNALCKFRLSAHSVEIETGRYNASPLEQRICKFCTSPHVENEYHFCQFVRFILNIAENFYHDFAGVL